MLSLKNFSELLGKDKTSIALGLGLSLFVTATSSNTNVKPLIAQAYSIDTEVLELAENDVRNLLSFNLPSKEELQKIESGLITVSVKEQILVTQGVEQLANSVEVAEKLAEKERKIQEEEERKRLEVESKTKTAVFKVTGYCTCKTCCGVWSPEVTGKESHTFTGTVPCAGRTVAVDPNVIPLGSTVIINGVSYIAEDTGSAVVGNVIDIYFDSHQEACDWGLQYLEVTYILQ